ncbi:flagellar protein FlaG [Vogesella sp. LIG4]|uniref:flagellar protein FlaG n=1 Tax=Vogesella sp. LIG4 TaxID=1192162 RepID=UPI00081F765D|nr:flagellar protein FlaG [Vogesella sp. LIG4]SCK16325.1 flagellar protein FlaG [Vogesella sp. LIG4]
MNILGNLANSGVLPTVSGNNTDQASRGQGAAAAHNSAAAVAVSPQAVQAANAADKGHKSGASDEELRKAVEKVSAAMQSYGRSLNFSIDKDSGMQVVKVIDTQTNQVVRQMPSEDMLRIAKNLDKVLGVLVEQHA